MKEKEEKMVLVNPDAKVGVVLDDSNIDKKFLGYPNLGVDFSTKRFGSAMSPIYIEGQDDKPIIIPNITPYQEAINLSKDVYQTRNFIGFSDPQVINAEFNVILAQIIANKTITEMDQNCSAIFYSGLFNICRVYIVNETPVKLFNRLMHGLSPYYIFRAYYTQSLPKDFTNAIRIPKMFLVYDQELNQVRYIKNNVEATEKMMQLMPEYGKQLSVDLSNSINTIIDNIAWDKMADYILKTQDVTDPDKLTPGDKLNFIYSIMNEQSSNDFNKMIEILELILMNNYALFIKYKVDADSMFSAKELQDRLDSVSTRRIAYNYPHCDEDMI